MSVVKVYLAPMDGVTDAPLRKILCRHGHYDACFTEFLRVTEEPLSVKTLRNEVPELKTYSETEDGTKVRVQLLGDHAMAMAKSAALALQLGAHSIDINFGCPSRFVHHSGSMLLKEPQLMHDIVERVREAMPPEKLLSVKIRSGFAHKDELPAIVEALAIDGVSEIIVHCRTRKELYQKEAIDWTVIRDLHALYPQITFVANGEINSKALAMQCMAQSGCQVLMSGRGALMVPNLGEVIKEGAEPYSFSQIMGVLREVYQEFDALGMPERKLLDRCKQFCGYARRDNPEVSAFFKTFARTVDKKVALELIESNL
ncbi:MAG: tRNA-dihydrouridine synthase [Succinivibrio sp.]|nr:tRNA-dihydrouridine synthase [Succinivibrio sp.]